MSDWDDLCEAGWADPETGQFVGDDTGYGVGDRWKKIRDDDDDDSYEQRSKSLLIKQQVKDCQTASILLENLISRAELNSAIRAITELELDAIKFALSSLSSKEEDLDDEEIPF
ncbi:hypothetical protein [Solemya velum gill symbiont]|uniref:hypothetical protein n=1 Tax=Solemya velum gill symbiont TaxID=2340 RepID=UPI000995E98E|nr:hypothetical protein [Solemya velum gill symbiont]OOY36512.1 hypothetical protein BOV89_12240 [Solemya velum gill symbiont]OOY42974.1 hypothetical protein BOV92_12410 [Solemya velum gill symbiont]OOY49057.1 hypothetical protein BOV94_12600 [Solemya velum gill symbiont]